MNRFSTDLYKDVDHSVRIKFGTFIKEFNQREWCVRIGKEYESFEEYTKLRYSHREEFGTGFVVSGRPIPYFHPNRSFHDEVIWLNNHLYYDKNISFKNKLVNSAIVKFYGPSRTLSIATGYVKDLPYLTKTETPYIDFDRLESDDEYLYTLQRNLEVAAANKQQIWGTTELRTSLQIAARNYARSLKNGTLIDIRGVKDQNGKVIIPEKSDHLSRKMRTSDMVAWIASLTNDWSEYYQTRPTMEESYNKLTSLRGIGPYYGYHFSSNLARMPGIGGAELIDAQHKDRFAALNIEHGNLDENADYVVAGPGAMATLKALFPDISINSKTAMELILKIRDDQHNFLDISSDKDYKYMSEATELGKFTTFGIEIALCQFNVFNRLKSNPAAALARANAPISKEVGGSAATSVEDFLA